MRRREILMSAGCTLFLPALESFGQNRVAPTEADVKRLFCISMGYGFFTDVLPQTGGANYALSDHMEPLKKHRDHFTLYSKMKFGGDHVRDHKCVVGNTTTNPDSLDQIVADHIGHLEPVMKEQFGQNVKFRQYGAKKGWAQRLGGRIFEDAFQSFEERLTYARFGL